MFSPCLSIYWGEGGTPVPGPRSFPIRLPQSCPRSEYPSQKQDGGGQGRGEGRGDGVGPRSPDSTRRGQDKPLEERLLRSCSRTFLFRNVCGTQN